MGTPGFITDLRKDIGHRELWLVGSSATVWRPGPQGTREILLVRRRDNGMWTPICGIVEPGELPSEAVVREAAEEAGVRIEVQRFVRVCAEKTLTYSNGDHCRFLDHDFLCRWVDGEARVSDDESSEVGWFLEDRLPEMPASHRRRIEVSLSGAPGVICEHDGGAGTVL